MKLTSNALWLKKIEKVNGFAISTCNVANKCQAQKCYFHACIYEGILWQGL